jgi:hypothetical protein
VKTIEKYRYPQTPRRRPNYASSSVAGQTSANHCHQSPNGNTTSATNDYAIKSKPSKHKPIEHASVRRLTFAPSLITSDDSDIITIIGIELNGSRSCFVVIA